MTPVSGNEIGSPRATQGDLIASHEFLTFQVSAHTTPPDPAVAGRFPYHHEQLVQRNLRHRVHA